MATNPQAAPTENEHGFRRRFPRREFTQPSGILIRGQYIVVKAVEIGEGGIMVASDHALEAGQHAVLNFFIPRKSFVSVTAEVLYRDPTAKTSDELHYGFKFVSLDFESQRMIRDYIAEKSNS